MDDGPITGGEAIGTEGVGEPEQAEAVETPEGGELEAPARSYVEVDDEDNRYVPVKVDGEDIEIPFSELKRGYSRQEDYTRKTQETAKLRDEAKIGLQLQQALQANPELTLRILSDQYGINFAPPPPAAEAQRPEFDDPLEEQIWTERQARLALEERLAQRDADAELSSAVNGLKQQFNLNDEDVGVVVQTAYQMRVGTEAFPQIWKAIAYDRISARVQAQRAEAERKAAETTSRQGAAAAASQIVSTGTGAGNGLTNQVDHADRHMSIREAIELAMDQHGV
jgi:hypothetical protein